VSRAIVRAKGHHAIISDQRTLVLLTELEIEKSLRLQYPLSFIVLVAELEGGSAIAHPSTLARQLARVVSQVLRRTDAVTPSSSSPLLEILLVNADVGDLTGIVERILVELARHRFELSGKRTAVKARLGMASFPRTAATARDLRTQASPRISGGAAGEHEPSVPTG
jgi:hypothetical protein